MMAALRVTFLSSLVLELLASVSVALVAVAIGLRLLAGHLTLQTSLFVLVLAPEAYLPLRQLGAEFHASAEGKSAALQVFDVLDRPEPPRGWRTDVPDPARDRASFLSPSVSRTPAARGRLCPALLLKSTRGSCSPWPGRVGVASPRCWPCCSASSSPTKGR